MPQARKDAKKWRGIARLGVVVFATLACMTGNRPASAQSAPAPFTTEVNRAPPTPVVVARSPWPDIAPLLPRSADGGDKVRLRRIAVRGNLQRTDIVLVLARATSLSAFAVADPLRVVIDGANLDFAGALEAPPPRKTLVADFRFGPLSPGIGRLLFDCPMPVKVAAVSGRTIGGETEVTVSIVPAGRANAAQQAPLTWGAVADVDAPPATDQAARAGRALPLLMIDPGHGGVDPGAVTEQTVLEKDVVLAVAHRLRGVLEARGKVRVAMTRQGDETVPLDKRTALTRSAQADLFVSLHADIFAGQAGLSVRGGSVYVLGAKATSVVAQALVERENAADQRAGIADMRAATDAAVEGILADLTARETQTLSQAFQDTLVRQLRRSMVLAREPERAAAFRVLNQAETPAVLIELGYMSNSQDIALLQSAAWQTAVAARIADAVETYFARPHGFALDR